MAGIGLDHAQYLGSLNPWLKSEPKDSTGIGFYIGCVEVVCQGEHYGWLINHDDAWHYYEGDVPDWYSHG